MGELLTVAEIEKIRRILEIVSDNDLTELAMTETDGFSVTVTAGNPVPVAQETLFAAQSRDLAAISVAAPLPVAPVPAATNRTALGSPMVGIFYSAPAPGEPSFLTIGDVIKPGETIGLIEAMKVFSEVPAERGGRVLEIAAKDGSLVQRGQPLIYLEVL